MCINSVLLNNWEDFKTCSVTEAFESRVEWLELQTCWVLRREENVDRLTQHQPTREWCMVWRHETGPILTNQRAEMDIVVSVSVTLHHHPMWVLSFSTILLYRSQQDAHATEFILSDNCSTCFGRYYHPSSGAQTTVHGPMNVKCTELSFKVLCWCTKNKTNEHETTRQEH